MTDVKSLYDLKVFTLRKEIGKHELSKVDTADKIYSLQQNKYLKNKHLSLFI